MLGLSITASYGYETKVKTALAVKGGTSRPVVDIDEFLDEEN